MSLNIILQIYCIVSCGMKLKYKTVRALPPSNYTFVETDAKLIDLSYLVRRWECTSIREELPIINTSNKYRAKTLQWTSWYSTLFLEDFKSTDGKAYTCIIRNAFGSLNIDIDTRETTQGKTGIVL
jgi:hypothetical protein